MSGQVVTSTHRIPSGSFSPPGTGANLKRYQIINNVLWDGEKRLGLVKSVNWIPSQFNIDGSVTEYQVQISYI